MIRLVKVVALKPLGDFRLWLKFSDGLSGECDFAPMILQGGAMVDQLKDPTFFGRVFISFGVPSWPNGFDVDAIQLHKDMVEAGLLTASEAA